MANISAVESITLDGVMQGPGRADEDPSNGFRHGGWAQGFQDQVAMEVMGEGMATPGAMLFGRRTYEDLMAAWTANTEPNPFTEYLTNAKKLVVSRSSDTVLKYPNSTLLAGEAVETVAALKAETEGSLNILGSGELVRTLHAAGLMDGYTLQIHPIVLGSGTKLFADGERADLTLTRSVTTTTGVIIALYTVGKPTHTSV